METVRFFCCKISSRLALNRISDFFMLKKPVSWKDYIILAGDSIQTVLKDNCNGKTVYVFSFGCITFVNFLQEEVYSFIKYIGSVTGNVDYTLSSAYNESHLLEADGNGYVKLFKGCDEGLQYDEDINLLVAAVIAKSTELYRMETEVDRMLDNVEKYIDFLKRGSLHTHNRKMAKTMSKILRFEYAGIESVRIYDRPFTDSDTAGVREVYDRLSEHYELNDRFEIMQSKINDLRGILNSYSVLSNNALETRLLVLEVFLLALFPLSHLVRLLLDFH